MENLNLKKKLLRAILFIAYPAYVLQACVISPVFTITDGNILYKDSVLSLAFYFLGIIVDLFVIFLSLSVVIYGLYKLTLKDARSVILAALLAPVFKNILKLAVSPFVDGVLNLNQLAMDAYSLSVSSVFEILQLALVLFIVYRPIKEYKENLKVANKASSALGKERIPCMDLLPFEKIFSIKNPLQKGAFVSALVISIVRVIMHLIDDFFGIANISFSMMFLLPYVLSLMCGVLGYFLMLYIFISIGTRDE